MEYNEVMAQLALSVAKTAILAEDALLIYKLDSNDLPRAAAIADAARYHLTQIGQELGCEDEDLINCRVMECFFGAEPTIERAREFVEMMT